MSSTYDIAGFKKYILLEPDRFRIDGLSIWYNSIPIPLDLFDLFFESWRDYFQSYLDHLMAALMLEGISAADGNIEFSASSFPDADLVKQCRIMIHKKMETLLKEQPEY